MSKVIRKVLKASILPASLMIVGKIIGLIIADTYFGLDIYINHKTDGFFSVELFLMDRESALLANAIANICMFLPILIGNIYLLFRYDIIGNSNKKQRTLIKTPKVSILNWITNKKYGFIKIFTWTAFQWITGLIIITDTINDASYMWLGAVAFLSIIMTTWGVTRTFEKETATIYPRENNNYG